MAVQSDVTLVKTEHCQNENRCPTCYRRTWISDSLKEALYSGKEIPVHVMQCFNCIVFDTINT